MQIQIRTGGIHAGNTLPLGINERSIGLGVTMFLFGLPFIAFPLFFTYLILSGAEVTGDFGPVGMSVFFSVFVLVGVFISGFGIRNIFGRTRITIDATKVNLSRRTIRGKETWTEPLASYRGLLTKEKRRKSSDDDYTIFLVILKHTRIDEKDVTLVRMTGSVDLRSEAEQFAKLLQLPVLAETADGGYEARAVSDLDKSVAELAAEGKLEIAAAPAVPLENDSIWSLRNHDGYTYEQNFRTPSKIYGAIFTVIGGALLYWYYGPGVTGEENNPFTVWMWGAVFALMGLGSLILGPMVRQKFEIDPHRAQTTVILGGVTVFERTLPADKIEELKITEKSGVRIISDNGKIVFGLWLDEDELQHIHDATLATLARGAPAAQENPTPIDAKKLRAAQMVVLAELNAGRAPAEILKKDKSLGDIEAAIFEAMRQIAKDTGNAHSAVLSTFLSHHDPAPAESAPAKSAHRLKASKERKKSRISPINLIAGTLKYGVPAVVIVWFFAPVLFSDLIGEEPAQATPRPPNERQLAAMEIIERSFSDFDIKPSIGNSLVFAGARGVFAEAQGNDLVVAVDEIRLELDPDDSSAKYKGVSFYVIPRDLARQSEGRSAGNLDIRGTLTAESPTRILRDKVFVLPGLAKTCADGCQAKLIVSVKTSPSTGAHINTAFGEFEISQSKIIARPDEAKPKHWDTLYTKATRAMNRKQYNESERLFKLTIAFIEENLGADHPALARTLMTMATNYKIQQRQAEYETLMVRTFTILQKHSASEIQRELSDLDLRIDKEMVARRLGDFYWDQRRYDQSYIYYKHAYEAVPELQTSEYSRNLKLAYGSAGVMKTACMLQKFDEAERALNELKERIKKVKSESRESLSYWIRTGEPRVSSRKC